MTKIRSVFSRPTSTYWSWPDFATARLLVPEPCVRPTLTTELPFLVTALALPLTTSATACSRSARRLSSRGLGRSSTGAELASALATGAGSTGGAALAPAGSMTPTLVTIAAPSSPTTTLRTTCTSVDVTDRWVQRTAVNGPGFGAHVNVCKRTDV